MRSNHDFTQPRPARPSTALARAGVRPRRSRGQNFLVQPAIADRIVQRAELTRDDWLIEIGPGLGILSDRAARSPLTKFTLVEIDSALASALELRFFRDPRVEVVNRDFLSFDLAQVAASAAITPKMTLKVIGNLPFSVATAILERLCALRANIARMVMMFQREVADRIRARPGSRDYGALSVFTALYWEIIEHFRVSAGSFHPKPRVDAEVLVFISKAGAAFASDEEAAVLTTIRASFSAPRKTIRNALSGGLRVEANVVARALAGAGIDPSARPAELAAADFIRLAHAIREEIGAGTWVSGPRGPLAAPRDA